MSRLERGLTEKESGFVNILLEEATNYYELSPEALIDVGQHISLVPHTKDGFYSLHFRRNLEEIKGEGFAKARAFSDHIGEDLHKLALMCDSGELPDLKLICGLTTLAEAWGSRHGFDTITAIIDPEIILTHDDEIKGKLKGILALKMTLFMITREGLIREYGRKK